jgi:hypothetical protein
MSQENQMAQENQTPPTPELKPPTSGGGGGTDQPRAFSGGRIMTNESIPAAPNPYDYRPDIITLYGIKLNQGFSASLPFGENYLTLGVDHDASTLGPDKISIAAIYGYSFEGHCYRLDKPKLLIIEQDDYDAQGCGFSAPYRMWSVTSKAMIMEVALDFDTAEKLVLEANLPGKRSPNTYGNDMALGHRGGKLNRAGG